MSGAWLRNLAAVWLYVLAAASPAMALPFWIAWEGDDWPENQGWTRDHGPGSTGDVRTLQNGVLTLDGLANAGPEYDYVYMEPSNGIHLAPGETFVAEWRVRVVGVEGYPWDAGVVFISDDGWGAAFDFSTAGVAGGYEHNWYVPFVPGVWHSFRLLSGDFETYTLMMDGGVVREGVWNYVLPGPWASWGDGAIPPSSTSDWDYLRFGVTPEVGSLAMTVFCGALGMCGSRR